MLRTIHRLLPTLLQEELSLLLGTKVSYDECRKSGS
jgi:hypothetical protein